MMDKKQDEKSTFKQWFVDKILPWIVISSVSILVGSYGWILITLYDIKNNFTIYKAETDKKIAGVYRTLDFLDAMGYNGEKKVQSLIEENVRDYVEKIRFSDIEKDHKLLRDIVKEEIEKNKVVKNRGGK